MQLFTTTLRTREITPRRFLKLLKKWNDAALFEENKFPDLSLLDEEKEAVFSKGVTLTHENLSLSLTGDKQSALYGARYVKKDARGIQWTTDYILDTHNRKICISLERSFSENAESLRQEASVPYFISTLIRDNLLEADHGLAIKNRPHALALKDLPILANLILGKTRYSLPVIYVSQYPDGSDPVDVNRLAASLKGVAHLLCLRTRFLEPELRKLCDSQNVYNGNSVIYFPNPALAPYLIRGASPDKENISLLEHRIKQRILWYTNQLTRDEKLSWDYICLKRVENEKLSIRREKEILREKNRSLNSSLQEEKERIASLLAKIDLKAREQAERELEELYAVFEEEHNRLEEKARLAESLTRENQRLREENAYLLEQFRSTSGQPLLYRGAERDFFTDEIKDFVLQALQQVFEATPEKTRKKDALRDVLAANDYQELLRNRAETVKRLLSSYDRLTPDTRKALEDMGFEIGEEGKHYKLTYFGDERYVEAIPKTPSDHRSGKNIVSQINNRIL